MIEKSDCSALDALAEQYTSELEQKYPATCNDCKGHNITRASSVPKEGNEGKDPIKLSQTELRQKYSGNSIHMPHGTSAVKK